MFAQDDPPRGPRFARGPAPLAGKVSDTGRKKGSCDCETGREASRARVPISGSRGLATVPSADRIPGKVSLYYIVTEDYIYIRTLNKQKKKDMKEESYNLRY